MAIQEGQALASNRSIYILKIFAYTFALCTILFGEKSYAQENPPPAEPSTQRAAAIYEKYQSALREIDRINRDFSGDEYYQVAKKIYLSIGADEKIPPIYRLKFFRAYRQNVKPEVVYRVYDYFRNQEVKDFSDPKMNQEMNSMFNGEGAQDQSALKRIEEFKAKIARFEKQGTKFDETILNGISNFIDNLWEEKSMPQIRKLEFIQEILSYLPDEEIFNERINRFHSTLISTGPDYLEVEFRQWKHKMQVPDSLSIQLQTAIKAGESTKGILEKYSKQTQGASHNAQLADFRSQYAFNELRKLNQDLLTKKILYPDYYYKLFRLPRGMLQEESINVTIRLKFLIDFANKLPAGIKRYFVDNFNAPDQLANSPEYRKAFKEQFEEYLYKEPKKILALVDEELKNSSAISQKLYNKILSILRRQLRNANFSDKENLNFVKHVCSGYREHSYELLKDLIGMDFSEEISQGLKKVQYDLNLTPQDLKELGEVARSEWRENVKLAAKNSNLKFLENYPKHTQTLFEDLWARLQERKVSGSVMNFEALNTLEISNIRAQLMAQGLITAETWGALTAGMKVARVAGKLLFVVGTITMIYDGYNGAVKALGEADRIEDFLPAWAASGVKIASGAAAGVVNGMTSMAVDLKGHVAENTYSALRTGSLEGSYARKIYDSEGTGLTEAQFTEELKKAEKRAIIDGNRYYKIENYKLSPEYREQIKQDLIRRLKSRSHSK